MIFVPALVVLSALASNGSAPDKTYYVAGHFYKNISMHLACSFIKRDSGVFKASLAVRSVDDKADSPAVEVEVASGERLAASGMHKGLMAFSLPMSSIIRVDLPVAADSSYNERYMSLIERFDFANNKTFYFASIGGTKEDLGSVEAVGFCSIDAVEGDLQKDSPK